MSNTISEQKLGIIMSHIENIIRKELSVIEKTKNVKILFACESGSRCWGFPSQDSNYDVRFIYARTPREYLKLQQTHDTYEWMLNDELDIIGWDITKFLLLMNKSNTATIEWLDSCTKYVWTPEADRIHKLSKRCFNPLIAAQAYTAMGYNYIIQRIRNKNMNATYYLYAIRALLAAKWCIQKQTPIPVPFQDLKFEMLEPELIPIIDGIVTDKILGIEKEMTQNIPELDNWINRSKTEIDDQIPHTLNKGGVSDDELDDFFIDLVWPQSN